MKIDPGPQPILAGEKQITVGDLDIVLDSDGIALKGFLRLTGGSDHAETADQLGKLLTQVSNELMSRPEAAPANLPRDDKFGAAFD